MTFEWTEDISTGSPVIDGQHKELFRRVNLLLDGIKNGRNTELNMIFKFLGEYVVSHFRTEEDYMMKYKYPGYSPHKIEHKLFTQSYEVLKKKFEREGATIFLMKMVEKMVCDWLINHIGKRDKDIGRFLKEKMHPKPDPG